MCQSLFEGLYNLNGFHPPDNYDVGTSINATFQKRKLKPRDVKSLPQGHTAGE